jgi:hypothetical protein
MRPIQINPSRNTSASPGLSKSTVPRDSKNPFQQTPSKPEIDQEVEKKIKD